MIKNSRTDAPNGPVKKGTCDKCGMRKTSDVFAWNGHILCGDCRYFARNGRWPDAVPSFAPLPEYVYEDGKAEEVHVLHRFRKETCGSMKEAEILMQLELEEKMRD